VAGRAIMPAAQSKRCAYPASRRSVPRGTEPTRTAGKSWRPGRSRGIWARPFPRTLAPLFPDANRRSLRRRHPGHTSGPRPYGPFRRPQLDVGADLSLQGISRRSPAASRRRQSHVRSARVAAAAPASRLPPALGQSWTGPIYLLVPPHHNDQQSFGVQSQSRRSLAS